MTMLLLIDDAVRVRRRRQQRLAAAGYRGVLAANGVEGLSILRTVSVDAIRCDLMLPGMPGVQGVHCVRRTLAWQALPLVLMHTAQQAYLVPQHAITASLPVTCTATAVLTTLARVLRRHPPAPAASAHVDRDTEPGSPPLGVHGR